LLRILSHDVFAGVFGGSNSAILLAQFSVASLVRKGDARSNLRMHICSVSPAGKRGDKLGLQDADPNWLWL